MAAPYLLRHLFTDNGFGTMLNKDIIPKDITIPYTATLYTENGTFTLPKSCPVRITCVGGGGYNSNSVFKC